VSHPQLEFPPFARFNVSSYHVLGGGTVVFVTEGNFHAMLRKTARRIACAIESLESRRLFSAGALDPSFGNGGITFAEFVDPQMDRRSLGVLPTPPGEFSEKNPVSVNRVTDR
jgi:hypothetical protein